MDRRSFLRGAAVAASGLLAGGVVSGCSNPSSHGAEGEDTTPSTGPNSGPPNWRTLAGSLRGALLQPGDAGYPAAGHLYNSLYTPDAAAIAQCESASDVQRCIAFAREHNVELTARAGGHSYGGYSSCPGLVIDVSRMQGISTGGATAHGQGVATVGAGATLINVYSQLGSQGLLLPGGSCPTVGIAGLALGGGIGVFSRAYGLTCDQMASVEIVTADGVLRRCGPGQDEDLYWASRGGGGGNFGIVTSFGFQVHPIPEAITLFTFEWPWGAAASVLDAWLRWIPSTPDQLWANCQLFSSGNVGSGLVKVTGVFMGTVSACSAALDPLTVAVGRGHDLPLRRARGVPDGHDDRGGVRGRAVGPVRRTRPVAVHSQVLLRRRTTPARSRQRDRVRPVDPACHAARRRRRRRVRRLRRDDQPDRGERDGVCPPRRGRLCPVLDHLPGGLTRSERDLGGVRMARKFAPASSRP